MYPKRRAVASQAAGAAACHPLLFSINSPAAVIRPGFGCHRNLRTWRGLQEALPLAAIGRYRLDDPPVADQMQRRESFAQFSGLGVSEQHRVTDL